MRATDKIKVMHLVQSIEIGGLENGVVNLANLMNPACFETVICCLRKEGPLKCRLKETVKVICLHQEEGFHVSAILRVAALCKQKRIRVVHTHGWAGGLLLGVLGGRLARVPVIINGEHGVLYTDRTRRIILQKILLRLVDRIIPVSENLKQDVIKNFRVSPGTIRPIINGVDTDVFKPDNDQRSRVRQELGLKRSDFIIGSVGRLVKVKDQKAMITALKEIRKTVPDARLLLVGDGPMAKTLEDYTDSLGLTGSVIFMGERHDVPAVLNAMDVFVLSSLDEGLPNTILEAMAVGKPVVATRVGGTVEIVLENRTGLLVPPADPHALAIKILEVKGTERIYEFGANARAHTVTNFSIHKMVEAYEAAYRECLELR